MNPKKKFSMEKFGKKCYFLGQSRDGTNYFIEEAKWDCGWYWGGGYIESYTNNNNPVLSKDIESHSHFSTMFFGRNKNAFDAFKEFFINNPFTDDEIWQICELMKSFYIAREYSDMLYLGGAHYSTNPAKDAIQNNKEYKRISKEVIPTIMEDLYTILEDKQASSGDDTPPWD